MCQTIRLANGTDIDTVRKFQDYFKVDATLYGFSNEHSFLDCLCSIDLPQFFKDNPQLHFYYDWDDY